MRYEAKHSYFKRMAGLLGNFKNIPKTLAQRHQQYMCYQMCVPATYLRQDIECSSGIYSINNSYSNLNKQVICNIGSNAVVGDLKYGTQLLDVVPALENDAAVRV